MTKRHQAEARISTGAVEGTERTTPVKEPISRIEASFGSTPSLCHARYLVAACLSDCRAETEASVPCLSRSHDIASVGGADTCSSWSESMGDVAFGRDPSGATTKQLDTHSLDDCGVMSVLLTKVGSQRQWKRFSGLMSWLEVTLTTARWWESTGPGDFVAIQVPLAMSGEALFALCIALDGQTSLRAVFCDPARCRQSGCPVQTTETRFDYEVGGVNGDRCPIGIRQ